LPCRVLGTDAPTCSGEPTRLAGGFTLDGLDGWFIAGIERGPSNMMGISLPLVRRLLTEVGVMVTDLWKRD
jgi:nucleoside triphosphate pyrophosphatase